VTDVSPASLFRALAWLRWRILMNAITRSGARDILERFSRTAESLLPIAVIVLLVPAGVALLALGGWTGSRLPVDPVNAGFGLQVIRWVLVVVIFLALLGPMLMPAGQQAAGLVRLMLLPIPTPVLYAAHALGAITDPWIFLSIPLLLGVSGGAIASGGFAIGALTLFAGAGFLFVVLGIAAFSNAALQLLVRNRRRAELLVVIGMMFIVFVSLMPSALIPERSERRGAPQAPVLSLPGWVRSISVALPSELYAGAGRLAAEGLPGPALAATGALWLWAAAAHGLTWPIYRRLLRTPSSNGGARRRAAGGRLHTRIPGLNPRTSAVAVSYVRLGLRTPRGRTIVLMPIVMLAVFAALFYGRGTAVPIGPVRIGSGYSLGIFGLFLALMSLAPFAFNQFAVDRAGLTLQFLSPISTRELLYGKAVGGALIVAVPCVLAIVAGIVTGGHSLPLWLATVFGAVAAYALLAPVAAVLSLIFPRTVDLSSVGQSSNAHQAAGLLGLLAFAVACGPPVVLGVVALRVLSSPAAATGLLAVWLMIALALSYIGFMIAERLLEERKENLAMVAAGR
jgi:hypothetical protein